MKAGKNSADKQSFRVYIMYAAEGCASAGCRQAKCQEIIVRKFAIMVNEPNPYACLGLMPGNSQADIKRRYRELAKQYHPDLNGHGAGLEEKLRDLNAAYAFLSNPARKAEYDATYAAIFSAARAPQPTPSLLSPSLIYAPRHRSRRRPLRVAVGLTLLMLLSTGVGFLFNAVNGSPVLSELFTQASKKPTVSEAPPPVYSFLPSHNVFDTQGGAGNQSTASVPASIALGQNSSP